MAELPSVNIPIPDPSEITVREIEKARSELRQDCENKVQSLRTEILTRLEAMDKATTVLSDNVNRVPTLLDREASRIVDMLNRSEELTAEKFGAIAGQIRDRDIRLEQDKNTATKAVEAAFQAQKEAAGKSEVLATKMIDSIQAMLMTSNKTTDDKIALINGTLARIAGGDQGSRQERQDFHFERQDTHMTIGTGVGIGGAVLAFLTFISLVVFGVNNMVRPQGIGHEYIPTVGADTKRVDDLVARLNELTARMNIPSPPPPAK